MHPYPCTPTVQFWLKLQALFAGTRGCQGSSNAWQLLLVRGVPGSLPRRTRDHPRTSLRSFVGGYLAGHGALAQQLTSSVLHTTL